MPHGAFRFTRSPLPTCAFARECLGDSAFLGRRRERTTHAPAGDPHFRAREHGSGAEPARAAVGSGSPARARSSGPGSDGRGIGRRARAEHWPGAFEVTTTSICGSSRTARCVARRRHCGCARAEPSCTHVRGATGRSRADRATRSELSGGRQRARRRPRAEAPPAGTPAYLQQVYDLTYLAQTNGAGDTVAIVDAYDDPTRRVRSRHLPLEVRARRRVRRRTDASRRSTRTVRARRCRPDAGWEREISLDLDAVSALCPKCHVLLVEADASHTPPTSIRRSRTAAAMGADQISNSWSGEDTLPPTDAYSSANVPVVFATGDGGYYSTPYNGYTLNAYPASLPKVIAAGGTSVAAATGGAGGRGFAESAWSTRAGSSDDVRAATPTSPSRPTSSTPAAPAVLTPTCRPMPIRSPGSPCTTAAPAAGCSSAAPAWPRR